MNTLSPSATPSSSNTNNRPFAVIETLSHTRLSRIHFTSVNFDASILFRALYTATGIVVAILIVFYILASRFSERAAIVGIKEGIVTAAFLVLAAVYLYVSNRLQVRENKLRPAIPVSDDIELVEIRPRTRLGRIARTLRNDRLRRTREQEEIPDWIKGKGDLEIRVVRLPSSISFSDAFPEPLSKMLPEERSLGAKNLLKAWKGSIGDADFDFSLTEVGGIALASDVFDDLETVDYEIFKTWL